MSNKLEELANTLREFSEKLDNPLDQPPDTFTQLISKLTVLSLLIDQFNATQRKELIEKLKTLIDQICALKEKLR